MRYIPKHRSYSRAPEVTRLIADIRAFPSTLVLGAVSLSFAVRRDPQGEF
jgi:hypothetical protein